MAYQFPPEIEQLVREQMQSGDYRSEDDMLADALKALAIQRNDLEAIREGIRDMEAGRVQPLREAVAEIRKEHGFSHDEEA